MATPAGPRRLSVVQSPDDFLDLAEDDYEEVENENSFGVEPIDLEDALAELRLQISDATDFMLSDMFPEWEEAEAFYDGESDIERESGRSQLTKTVVRDTVRALKPSAMRIFTQAGEIAEYEPYEALNYGASVVAQQQTTYVNQLFWRYGGYRALLDATHNAFLKKIGLLKAYYTKNYNDNYMEITGATPEQVEAISIMPDAIIVEIEDREDGLADLEVVLRSQGGKICLEHVPLYEFFVDDNATGCEEGEYTIIGQRRNRTVSDARAMGLEYDGDWLALDSYDVEDYEASGESTIRRGYTKDHDSDKHNLDPANHTFLLTECYMRFDLDGTGVSQLYRFWLGGTSYEYIDHERVSENPYGACQIDPLPGAFFGRSIFDLLREDQNTQTSLLRATADNAHASNNARLAYHETMVNGRDVNNKVVGHPIRFRQPGMIQEIGVQSMVGSMLPLLQYLDQDAQVKAGSTNAAMGLDPDALQSTDKDAVRNTIAMAQGQIELMCRNIAETGLVPIFNKLLRLSLRHNPQQQVIKTNGTYVPVDQYTFTPDAALKVKVGIGMPDIGTKMAALERVAQKQEQIIAEYGLQNPIAGINHLFNTITDMASLMGLPNIGRYFSQITPEVAAQLDQITQQKQQAAQPEPPSQGIMVAEQIRAQARVQEQQLENQRQHESQAQDTRNTMIKLMMDDDFKRDKMAQDLAIADAQITERGVDKAFVQYEQNIDRDYKMQQFVAQQAEQRRQFMEQMRMNEAQQAQQQAQQQQAQQQPQQQPQQPQGPV